MKSARNKKIVTDLFHKLRCAYSTQEKKYVYNNATQEPYSFLLTDTTLASSNKSCFRKN